jgi:hypothetical protein
VCGATLAPPRAPLSPAPSRRRSLLACRLPRVPRESRQRAAPTAHRDAARGSR